MDGEIITADAAREAREEARGKGNHELAEQYDAQERKILARAAGEAVAEGDGELDDLPPGWSAAGLGPDEVRGARQLAHELMSHDPEIGDVLDGAMIEGPDGHVRPLGDHPAVLRALSRVAKSLQQARATPAKGNNATAAAVRSVAGGDPMAQADAIRSQRDAAVRRGRHDEARRLDEQERQILAQIHGNRPLVGQATRKI